MAAARTRVKICGLSTIDSVAAALSAGADAIGFVFYPPSPRHVAPATAATLAARGPHIRRVGVFVDPDDALLEAAISAGRLDVVQLQGRETPERIAAVRQRFAVEVWKAVGVATSADVRAAHRQAEGADALLLDARPVAGAELPGGNGLRFDWRILQGAKPAMPWVLAGGLDPANVGDAIRLTGAPFVDVSSGVEDAPGVKNLAKIAAFVEAARRV